MVAPLARLSGAAVGIASSGNITVPPRIQGPRELRQLAGAFRRMLERLGMAREELEQRVRDRTAELQAANKELEAFSYTVSHDLRAPLSTIDGFSGLLAKQLSASAANERGQHFVSRIRSGVLQMRELIDALLSLAQITRTPLRSDPVDLSAMALATLNACQEREPQRTLQMDIEPGLIVQGDAGLLRQVLDNLLGNAWKFCGQQAQARISLSRQTGEGAEGNEPVYVVRDNGAGFDMAHADKLFAAFQRLHSTSEFAGSGIGLATVHKIITRHKGSIWAESTPGQGAAFYFTLGEAALP